jgi:hypothetical protein
MSVDGTWLVTGSGTNSGASSVVASGIFTPGTNPGWAATLNPLAGHKIQVGGTWYTILTHTDTAVQTWTGGAPPDANPAGAWVLGGIPLDGDAWVIGAGHELTVDADWSSWTTGINGITITGIAAGTPGQLSFKNSAAGTYYIKIKAATNIIGTNLAVFGRLFMGGGTYASPTALVYDRKQVIEFLGTTAGYLDLTYLTAMCKCATPTNLYVTPYGYSIPVTWAADDTITLPANYELLLGTAISFTGATIPTGLSAATTYFVRDLSGSPSGNIFKVEGTIGGGAIDLTGSGSAVLATGQSRVTVVASTDVFTLTDDAGTAGSALTLMTTAAVGTAIVNTTPIRFYTTGILPTPLKAYELYYVVNYSLAAGITTFKVAPTSGGTALNITDTGTGTIRAFIGTPITHGAGAGDELPIFEDVTGAGNETWEAVAQVVFENEGPQTYDQQRLTITAITAYRIELSVDCDSLQYPGARVFLATRNVALRSNATGAAAAIVSGGTASTFQCEIRNVAGAGVGVTTFYGYGVSGTAHTISGVVSGCGSGVSGGTSNTISGVVSGCGTGVNVGTSHTISGVVSGCGTGVKPGTSHTISGVVSGCGTGVSGGTYILNGSVLRNNTADLNAVDHLIGYSAALLSIYQYAATTYLKTVGVPNCRTNCIYDIADSSGVSLIGQVKAWGPFGTIVTEVAPATPPVTLAYAYKMIPATVSHPTFLDFPLLAKKDVELSVSCYVKQNATGMTVRPTVQLLDPTVSWNVSTPDSTLATQTATDDTNWQTLTLSYTSTVADRTVILRCFGVDVSKYWHWMFATTSTVVVPGTASGAATLAKETGANARGGSGICAKLTPTSASTYGYWDFYVPATAATAFTLSLYWKKSASGFNGLLKVSIWDTDNTTLKNTSESVDITAADTDYHQFSATSVTPTATGLCRVRVEIKDGGTTGYLFIDDVAVT